ncbi:tRNA synthetase class II (A) [Tumebacillus sp. BK434]|uniref:alanine--tRNA ligase-related protein n=1 Tax=Tumebacillus sp. BK434 TaxID=2512169 RepID=UPI00104707EE|nr:alanine--tRNA ligase-related protein [Tumebacillus sp. BK434]TCP58013.1 tRNA synthetase class II (A) [Tumebacillus sp. BK434]
MKALEVRERYAEFLLNKGYAKLPERRVVNAEGDGPYFNGSALTPNIGYFSGQKEPESQYLFTQQRVFWTSYSYDEVPSPLWTIFQVMMSYYQFGQPDLREALTVGWELLTEGMGMRRDDLYILLPQDRQDLQRVMIEAGMPEDNLVLWRRPVPFRVEGMLSGFYCKFFLRHRHAFLPMFDVVNIIGPDGQLKVDSCLLLERVAFLLQGKASWFETEMFLPLMQKIEELDGLTWQAPFGHRNAATIRSLVAALADGAQLTGKGPGHVVKKILRELLHDRYRRGYEAGLREYVEPTLHCLRQIGYDWMEEKDRLEELFATEEHSYRKVHLESVKYLEKQVNLAVGGRRGPFTLDDLAVWKDSRGITAELAVDVLTARGQAVEGYQKKAIQPFMTFSDAYDAGEPAQDVKAWLLDMEARSYKKA